MHNILRNGQRSPAFKSTRSGNRTDSDPPSSMPPPLPRSGWARPRLVCHRAPSAAPAHRPHPPRHPGPPSGFLRAVGQSQRWPGIQLRPGAGVFGDDGHPTAGPPGSAGIPGKSGAPQRHRRVRWVRLPWLVSRKRPARARRHRRGPGGATVTVRLCGFGQGYPELGSENKCQRLSSAATCRTTVFRESAMTACSTT